MTILFHKSAIEKYSDYTNNLTSITPHILYNIHTLSLYLLTIFLVDFY